MEELDFKKYEEEVCSSMWGICISKGFGEGMMPSTVDLDGMWERIAPEYIGDAIPNLKDYPVVAVAWAGFLGIEAACIWDRDWEAGKDTSYVSLCGHDGFDALDDHVKKDVLGYELDSAEAKALNDVMMSCGEYAVALMHRSSIEGQTVAAYRLFSVIVTAMFKVGAAIGLFNLGYRIAKG